MPGRRYINGSGYRYGFNGKEVDLSVANNSYDFGARIYDGRIARWLSVDFKSPDLPSWSPYGFVNANPLRFVDPDGLFLLDVHQRIVWNGILSFTSNSQSPREWGGAGIRFKPKAKEDSYDIDSKYENFLYGIVGQGTIKSGGITHPDWKEAGTKSAHFDEMNYQQIIDNFATIRSKATELITQYKKSDMSEEHLGFEVGKQLHAIQDFYSHSNYVELYIQIYGKVKDLNSIPTLDKALSDKTYEKFAALLKTDLKTGRYPATGAGSHREMNHDVGAGSSYTQIVPETRGKKVTYETKAAEAVATKASAEYLQEIKTKVEGN